MVMTHYSYQKLLKYIQRKCTYLKFFMRIFTFSRITMKFILIINENNGNVEFLLK